MEKPVSKIFVAIGFLMAHFWSAALANEGSSTIPKHVDSNIELILETTDSDIDPSDVLQVFVGNRDACCEGKSPMAGRYAIDGKTITFDPVFDFVESQNYTIMSSDRTSEGKTVRTLTEFSIQPIDAAITPEVLAVYPSGDDIPENTLRFYIHFSTPMQAHMSVDSIKLVDEAGKQDDVAFMSFKQELWSEDRKRLTLLMDPGRIKRGLAQNLELGPALLEGSTYSLVVEEGWSTANGVQKLPRFETIFSVSQALRIRPDPELWQFEPPRTLTRDPLVIEFDRPFDHQLSQTSIRVLDENGRPIPGIVSIENHEKAWRFDPQTMWINTKVQILVDARLEDVAGNNLRENLDHAVEADVQEIEQKIITVELKPSP